MTSPQATSFARDENPIMQVLPSVVDDVAPKKRVRPEETNTRASQIRRHDFATNVSVHRDDTNVSFSRFPHLVSLSPMVIQILRVVLFARQAAHCIMCIGKGEHFHFFSA